MQTTHDQEIRTLHRNLYSVIFHPLVASRLCLIARASVRVSHCAPINWSTRSLIVNHQSCALLPFPWYSIWTDICSQTNGTPNGALSVCLLGLCYRHRSLTMPFKWCIRSPCHSVAYLGYISGASTAPGPRRPNRPWQLGAWHQYFYPLGYRIQC